jgi:hypothetical protein
VLSLANGSSVQLAVDFKDARIPILDAGRPLHPLHWLSYWRSGVDCVF